MATTIDGTEVFGNITYTGGETHAVRLETILYRLVNSETFYDLSLYNVTIGSYKKRIKYYNKFNRDGVIQLGDGKIDKRKVTISLTTVSMDDTEYIDFVNTIVEFIQDYNAPIYLEDVVTGRMAEIEIESIDVKESKGLERRIGDIKISAVMLDSSFNIKYKKESVTVSDKESITITNDSYLDAYPIIEVETLTENSDFSITNGSTDETIKIGSGGFNSDYSMSINSVTGFIQLIDSEGIKQEISYAIGDNSLFIHLKPGDNIISYNSVAGSVKLTIKYWERSIY